MEKSIIGRKDETERLKKYLASDRSEFIAIYGRRRVGKTFLVKELLEGKFTFRMTGRTECRSVRPTSELLVRYVRLLRRGQPA